MSIDLPAQPLTTEPARPRTRRRVPKRFFLGTIAFYGVILGAYLLKNSVLQTAIPNWRTVVPLLAGISFYIMANLFLLILGRGYVSRWVVLRCILATLILTVLLCLFLRSRMLFHAFDPSYVRLRDFLDMVARIQESLFAPRGLWPQMIQFTGMIVLEEIVKLAPVFAWIALGKIRTAHAAMLCGALCGLTFGTVEAISFGYLVYPRSELPTPITEYFIRFFVMSPTHGVWDALVGGLVFFLSGRTRSTDKRKPGRGAYAAAFACGVVFHQLHNALQIRFGPITQILTVFAFLAPLYLMARITRKRLVADGNVEDTQVFGDLHLLTISLATMFIGGGVVFSWAMGLMSRHV